MTSRDDIERAASDHRTAVRSLRARFEAADTAAAGRSRELSNLAADRANRPVDSRIVRPAVAKRVEPPPPVEADDDEDYRPSSWLI